MLDNILATIFAIFCAILLVVIVFGFFWMMLVSECEAPEPIGYTEYTVQEGDTLWSIASYSNGYGVLKTKRIIDDIKEKSECTATIHKGDRVYIPEYDME